MSNYQMNLQVLKSYEEEFKAEKNYFNNNSYNTFQSSYLNSCSNSYVRQMASKVNNLYSLTKKGYENIDKWWSDYNINLDGLENSLSNSSRSGNITESSVRNYVTSYLTDPDDYINNLIGTISPLAQLEIGTTTLLNNVTVEDAGEFSSIIAENPLFAEIFSYDGLAMNYFNSTGALTPTDFNLSNVLSIIVSTSFDAFFRTSATLTSTLIWAIGGIGQVIEWIIDVVIIAFAAVSSVISGVVDLCAWVNKLITGEEFESATVEIWDITMAMVADKKVIGLVDKLFEETEFGNIIKEISLFYETTKSVGEGLGEILGIVGITLLTFGAGGAVAGSSAATGGTASAAAGGTAAATTATATTTTSLASLKAFLLKGVPAAITGFGKGAEKSWGEGASLFEGLGFASLTAIWEGLQMSVGMAINATKPVSAFATKLGKTVNSKTLNVFDSLGRIFLDAGDNAAEGFVQPFLQTTYRGESYGELFEEAGGWGNVGIQFILGGALSFLGETSDLAKVFNNTGAKVSTTDSTLSSKITNALDEISINNKTSIFGIPFANQAEIVPGISNSIFDFLKKKNKIFDIVDNDTPYHLLDDYKPDNKIIEGIYAEYDRTGYISTSDAKKLQLLFKDSDKYYIGLHRTGMMKAENIINSGGLKLTGHLSSGLGTNKVSSIDDLKLNLTFDTKFPIFLGQLKHAGGYKTIDGIGDAIIYKIPKKASIEDIIYDNNGTSVLKNDYIFAYTTVDNKSVGKLKFVDELSLKISEYNRLINIKNSFEYKKYVDEKNNGSNVEIKKDFENLDKKIDLLDKKIKTLIESPLINYKSFSKEYKKSIIEMGKHYGDAGDFVNLKLSVGKMPIEILNSLDGKRKKDFYEFLTTTEEGIFLSKLTKEEIDALLFYTTEGFSSINDMLRTGDIPKKIWNYNPNDLIKNIDSAIAKYGGLKENTEIFRGIDVSAFTSQGVIYKVLFKGIDTKNLDQVYSVLKVFEGKTIKDLGYMSASPGYSTSYAENSNCSIVLDIFAKRGTSGAYINQMSRYYNLENEFLFARGTKLKMIEIKLPEIDANGNKRIVIKCVVE